jgi:hypothetical protein
MWAQQLCQSFKKDRFLIDQNKRKLLINRLYEQGNVWIDERGHFDRQERGLMDGMRSIFRFLD